MMTATSETQRIENSGVESITNTEANEEENIANGNNPASTNEGNSGDRLEVGGDRAAQSRGSAPVEGNQENSAVKNSINETNSLESSDEANSNIGTRKISHPPPPRGEIPNQSTISPSTDTTLTTSLSTAKKSANIGSQEKYKSVNKSIPDPDAIKIKFLFANRDGLTVIVECKITDSVGEIKGALLSMWPDSLSPCSEGDRIRLICMGKGILMPDGKSLKDCEIPVFKTHATPINVSVKPDYIVTTPKKSLLDSISGNTSNSGVFGGSSSRNRGSGVSQGCSCVIS